MTILNTQIVKHDTTGAIIKKPKFKKKKSSHKKLGGVFKN